MEDTQTIPCPHCSHPNRPGTLLCKHCKRLLIDLGTRNKTSRMGTDKLENVPAPVKVIPPGTDRLPENALLRILIPGNSPEILANVQADNTLLIIGRVDPRSAIFPDIDLTSYDAFSNGVSRVHAQFQVKENRVYLEDLNSANGTFVNGTKLEAQTPYRLRDGDVLRFGTLTAQIFFA
jgi:pSer/pThr/pTyr-binding forkhead associated (FHA) protein